jgi:cysteine desulfurase
MRDDFGNPSSAHRHGIGPRVALSSARATVASLLGASPSDIVFTSGATEACNLAVQGLALAAPPGAQRVIQSATEHKAVLAASAACARWGVEVVTIRVDARGAVDLAQLDLELRRGAAVVSVMAANNETGVLADVSAVAELARANGVPFHCDATQAVGRVPWGGNGPVPDLVSISAHKMYGLKGSGALAISREIRDRLAPLLYGGGQEGGLRAGTENVPAIVGLGVAAGLLAVEVAGGEPAKQREMRDAFVADLRAEAPGVIVNGEDSDRLPNTINVRSPGVPGEVLIAQVGDVISIATGSACSSFTPVPSHVLRAMGLSDEAADESVRISFGRFTTGDDLAFAARELGKAIKRAHVLLAAPPSGELGASA